ncbi:MAG: elongation factor P [Alphaproteobacteria bacterium]|nr:elongation factor P [Alphaproteobacteria bacterium]TAD91454.1 MAG: elongation factor P [Alphaproteobacteria bacterium]
MKINANELRQGNVLEHKGKLYSVIKAQHVSPGKGGAFVSCVLRDVIGGNKLDEKFRSGETVERVRIDEVDYQFLFADDTTVTFMDEATYEQLAVDREVLGDQAAYLVEGMKVILSVYEGRCVGAELPPTVVLEVTETDPVVKGQTAANSYKPATLSNGVRTQVPPFIEAGEKLVIRTEDGSYVERFKG